MKKEQNSAKTENAKCPYHTGTGGETHQTCTRDEGTLTTNQGVPISDNQNSLKSGPRGPTLLEDFILREKITHFDHERIPERIVHARGSGAHGFFQPYKNASKLTKASFLNDPEKITPVFVRFSTVAGGAGSGDMPRDVRGFAVKFYTDQGNFDLVGNNIPIFFIQDAMKFPDLVHSVKMEPDRGFPQAASAHDTFWDFVSLMPESMHMVLWAMSDRTIPRSLRMIEGFGIHTFRFINEKGKSTFVKFHWRPLQESSSVLWDEAVKINGADPDFHRRDLWEAIEKGDFPEWEFSVQAFSEEQANKFPFDVLDPTKFIPEELVPLQPLGKLTLNRNPDNFFAETEQVAFHPGHVVPGIDFSNDPLLQGRLHSYTDTQLSRLGGPNFHEIPINRPKCPMRNFQRDGMHRMDVPIGRVNYEPNTLDPSSPRENPVDGFKSFAEPLEGEKLRIRPESFSDHYSQARLFYKSQSKTEQGHIQHAYAFELAKVETIAIRKKVLGHLELIDPDLCNQVEKLLGMEKQREKIKPAVQPTDMKLSPSLSLIKKFVPTVKARKLGVLLADGFDLNLFKSLKKAFEAESAAVQVISKKIGGVVSASGETLPVDHTIGGGPSIMFDYIAVLTGKDVSNLKNDRAFQGWIWDAYPHLKFIGLSSYDLVLESGITPDEGFTELTSKSVKDFLEKAKNLRFWERENKL